MTNRGKGFAKGNDNMEVIPSNAHSLGCEQTGHRIPAQNGTARTAHLWQFIREFNPATASELTLTKELARRSADLDAMDVALAALEQNASEALVQIVSPPDENVGTIQQIRALVAGSERSEAILRRSLGSSRAFCRALGMLSEMSAQRHAISGTAWQRPDMRFSDESSCLAYLWRRVQLGKVPCQRCGSHDGGYWLRGRQSWECGICRMQAGVRVGSIMSRSPLPLVTWFAAIRMVLLFPNISATQIGNVVNVARAQTVQSMIARIRRATLSDNASQVLVDLDELYIGAPEFGVAAG